MTNSNRRDFLHLLGGASAATALSGSIERALAIPAHHRTGTIRDVEHIVILTQENRSFDHYFGALRGVRGFNDPTAVNLPNGKSVWHQPNGSSEVLPYRPPASPLGAQFLRDVAHGWNDGQLAFNQGKFDKWIAAKGVTAMTYYTREDIPYHYALADAFTICDAYYCSFIGSTDPNRYYMWSGWTGNDGTNGGPVLDNSEAGYDWRTYPELLEKAGISWKVYQDEGVGLDAAGFWGWTDDPYIGNYGDNSLLYFHQYQNAQPGSPLYEKARRGTRIQDTGTLFDILRNDVYTGKLPQISYIAAPEAYSEHPNWPVNYGAWYIAQVLDALTSNPEVWSKTVFIINYDENGGFFDHIVPPYAAGSAAQGKSTVDTTYEYFPGNSRFVAGPYGLCGRVPLIAVSPWSKGGYVCSEVFDHTSIIRFIEARYGKHHPELFETQISKWRRAVCGDLTSVFNFARPDHRPVALPSTTGYAPSDRVRHPDYRPLPPANQTLPTQEPGLRYARPLGYAFDIDGEANFTKREFNVRFRNTGKLGTCFQVRSGDASEGPWSYTVEADKSLSDTRAIGTSGDYDLSAYGPNGFLRSFKGSVNAGRANLDVDTRCDGDDNSLALSIANRGTTACTVTIENALTGDKTTRRLAVGKNFTSVLRLHPTFGWYDLLMTVNTDAGFSRRLAGHVESGDDSVCDPRLHRRHYAKFD
jgi:phospholipase C